MQELSNSPLTTEITDTISELFARDPLDWTDAQIDGMIAHLREQRKVFLAKPAKPEKASKEPALTKEQTASLSTEDLFAAIGL